MILFNLKKHTDNKIIAISGLKFWIIGVLGLCLVLIWSGYKIGIHYNKEILTKALSQELENFISSEELNLTQLRETQDADMDALAFHIGHLQARLMRLDALGSRLVSFGSANHANRSATSIVILLFFFFPRNISVSSDVAWEEVCRRRSH